MIPSAASCSHRSSMDCGSASAEDHMDPQLTSPRCSPCNIQKLIKIDQFLVIGWPAGEWVLPRKRCARKLVGSSEMLTWRKSTYFPCLCSGEDTKSSLHMVVSISHLLFQVRRETILTRSVGGSCYTPFTFHSCITHIGTYTCTHAHTHARTHTRT